MFLLLQFFIFLSEDSDVTAPSLEASSADGSDLGHHFGRTFSDPSKSGCCTQRGRFLPASRW